MKKKSFILAVLFSLLSLFGCGDLEQDLSNSRSSVKPQPPEHVYSFVVISDTELIDNVCSGDVISNLPSYIQSLAPDFVIVAGDLVQYGRYEWGYWNWDACLGDLFNVPTFPVLGEHDADCNQGYEEFLNYMSFQVYNRNWHEYGQGSVYYDVFQPTHPSSQEIIDDLPTVPSGYTSGSYYTFRFENAKFLMFEQGDLSQINTPTAWVERKLNEAVADPDVDFIFTVLHHPMFSIYCEDGCLSPVRNPYYQSMVNANVLGVFSGHDHVYSRYYAPYDGSAGRTAKDTLSYGSGMHFLNIGPSGYPPPTSWPPEWTGQASFWNHRASHLGSNISHITVESPGKMFIKTYNVDNGLVLVDEVQIKNLP